MIEKRPQVDLILEIRQHKPGAIRDGMVAQLGALKHYDYGGQE